MVRVNPNLPNEQGPYDPNHRVTGLFSSHDAVTSALSDLTAAGVPSGDVDVFSGPEGEHSLDPTGQSSTVGRWIRTVEQLVSDTSPFQELAAATLKAGGFLVAVYVGDDAVRKDAVMSILTRAGATDVKYWSELYVEQGHEDRPQAPAGTTSPARTP